MLEKEKALLASAEARASQEATNALRQSHRLQATFDAAEAAAAAKEVRCAALHCVAQLQAYKDALQWHVVIL